MDELKLCPFCGKPFILHSPKETVTAFRHYSEDCPLHEREMQFVNLPIAKTAEMLNARPLEDALRAELQAANEDADRLAQELELEQNPGCTCAALVAHKARKWEARA